MRRAGALAAAALLALASALGSAGCDLVSSTTPFGLGTQDYSSSTGTGGGGANLNGLWTGTTSTGGEANFQVADNTVSELIVTHVADEICTITFDASSSSELIANSGFTISINVTGGGSFTTTATFTSANTGTGSYTFQGLPAGSCPTAGSGTYSVIKATF